MINFECDEDKSRFYEGMDHLAGLLKYVRKNNPNGGIQEAVDILEDFQALLTGYSNLKWSEEKEHYVFS